MMTHQVHHRQIRRRHNSTMYPSPANFRRRAAAAGSGGALAAAAAVILSFFVATAVHPTDHSSVATIPRVAAFVPSARRGRSRIIAAYTSSDGRRQKRGTAN